MKATEIVGALKKLLSDWQDNRERQKKINETYRHIDMNAGGKFNRKSWFRMVRQMKKGQK